MDSEKEAACNNLSYNDFEVNDYGLDACLSECESVDSKNDSEPEDYADVEMECSNSLKQAMVKNSNQAIFLSNEEVFQNMIDLLKEVTSIALIPTTIARILLTRINWDKEKFFERYFSNAEKLFEEAGISDRNLKFCFDSLIHPMNNTEEECQICFMTVPPVKLIGIGCDHLFCNDCWEEYLTTKIMQDGNVQIIECAASSCDLLVSDALVMDLLKDLKVKLKYKHLITMNFIECNKLLKWCSSPTCNYAVKVDHPEVKLITCKCGFSFCFGCGEAFHEPVNCYLLKAWLRKCSDDSETLNWISVNTKHCPKCDTSIQKNGGCNYMTCTRSSCRYVFCWVCLGPAHTDGTYNCNRYKAEEDKYLDSKQKAEAALKKYVFFYQRYINHVQSLKFESNIKYDITKLIKVMVDKKKMTWLETQVLHNSVNILCMCRQTLMYSYVFAYYLKENNQSFIFTENQNDFERAVEFLSEYIERDIMKDNDPNIKQKILDKCKYLESRRKVLVDHINEGVENNWWEYSY